jgi:3',5'-nucleoside bisphosphate phosphatase
MRTVIDLHMHTTASDGRCTPEALVEEAYAKGIRTMSVTDHDTMAGVPAAAEAAARLGMAFVPGIEITSVHGGRDVHVLAYFLPDLTPALRALLAEQRRNRLARAGEIARRLAAAGAPIDVEALMEAGAALGGKSLARPQIAQALIAAGHVSTVAEAFERFLSEDGPAYVPHTGASPMEVVALIAAAGGLSSLAHPGYTKKDEVIPRWSRPASSRSRRFTARTTKPPWRTISRSPGAFNLAVSGGSDYHGAGTRRSEFFGVVNLPQEHYEALCERAHPAIGRDLKESLDTRRPLVDRSSSEVLALGVPLVAEMAAGDLGDRRLNARRDRLIATLEQHPDAGFPEACADDSEAEALYRFLRNDRLSLESLLGPHVVATAARCQALEEVLVVHDTTEMSFGGERARMGLTAVGPRHQAFWLHASLAVSAEGLRAPLGVIALAPFTRGAAPGPAPTWRERYDDAAKESRRWTTGVRAVRERCGPTVQVIHVMDREGDSYELFTELLAADERFVVRLAHDRRLTSRDDGSPEKLGAALAQASICFEQTVEVAARRGARPPQARKKHPPRAQRAAHLRIAARQVTFRRPGDLRDCDLPPGLTVNVVRAWEEAPPARQHLPPGRGPTGSALRTLPARPAGSASRGPRPARPRSRPGPSP